MARRYHASPLPELGPSSLQGEVAHHLAKVVRIRPGESIVLFDGAGKEAVGRVTATSARQVEVEVEEIRESTREPRVRVEVAFAAPRSNRADWVFEHGCEVGVHRFWPLITERARPGANSEKRIKRWSRIVAAATGQCDRARIPTVEAPLTLTEFVGRVDGVNERWIAQPGGDALGPAQGSAVLVVGPEGGFTDDELELLTEAGFRAADLGPLTLRTETAVLVGAARLLQ